MKNILYNIFMVFLILAFFSIEISCNEEIAGVELEIQNEEEQSFNCDTLLTSIVDTLIQPCDNLQYGEMSFEYDENLFVIQNPSVSSWISTYPGQEYGPSDSLTFYSRTIAITGDFLDNLSVVVFITDTKNPFNDCITESIYYDIDNGDAPRFCLEDASPLLLNTRILCNSSRISKRTLLSGGLLISDGLDSVYVRISSCQDNLLNATFSSDEIKNGRICNVEIQ